MKALPLLLFLISQPLWAHKGHHHDPSHAAPSKESSNLDQAKAFAEINSLYLKQVEPIFQKSCYDCHSQHPRLPWYYSLPGAHQLMDSDMKEAKEHLDMTEGFPFKGHGSNSEDLEALQEVILKEKMPPARYQFMHRNSSLTEQEKKIVLDWIEKSQALLKETHSL